jgi:CheY-like chemotaxis protein
MMLPVMNGWQFAIEFVAKFDRHCPIIVMSAAVDAKQRAKDIGAVGWIEKPFAFDKLLELIKKFERK